MEICCLLKSAMFRIFHFYFSLSFHSTNASTSHDIGNQREQDTHRMIPSEVHTKSIFALIDIETSSNVCDLNICLIGSLLDQTCDVTLMTTLETFETEQGKFCNRDIFQFLSIQVDV